MTRYRIYILFFALFSSIQVFAQERSATMYNMSMLPGRSFINPAFQPEAKFFFGTPGFSQINTEFVNSGFSFNDLFEPTDTGYILTPDRMIDNMPSINQLGVNMHLRPFAFGFRFLKNGYFTFDISPRVGVNYYYPRDLFGFLWKGNAHEDYLGERIGFDQMGIDVLVANEFSIGYSHQLFDALTVGFRGKLLFGIANISTTSSAVGLTTNADNFHLHIDADIEAKMSVPFVLYDSLFDGKDPLLNDDITLDDGLDYLKNNRGYAIDLGGTWMIRDRFLLSAAVNDIGYIDWGGNPSVLRAQGEFAFEGFDFTPLVVDDGDTEMDDLIEDLVDSLRAAFDFNHTSSAYRQWLTPTVHLGFGMKTYKEDMAAILLRSRFYQGVWYPKLTASYNMRVGRWLNLAASYGIERGNFTNLGIGFAIKAGPMQFHLISDNALAFFEPFSAKSVSVVAGLNWVFRTGSRKESTPSI